MPWLQLLVETTSEQAPAIEDTLLNAGAASVTFKEYIRQGDQEKPILEPALNETPLWQHTRVVGLFDSGINIQSVNWVLEQVFDGLDHTTDYRWEQLEDKDWEREWMHNYQPIQCDDKLWICPSWLTPPDHSAVNILLDPGLAFGTGTHPTTFLCLQWIAQQTLEQQNIIDYGCGSGILAVASLLLNAKHVTAVDIDPQALLATHDNLLRNRLDPTALNSYLPEDCPDTQADVVIANILAGPLVELAEQLISHIRPKGKICLSGILHTQASSVIEAYGHAIEFEPIAQKEEWVRLSGHKR